MPDDVTDRERQQQAIQEDPNLINAEFYRSDPAAHFGQRLSRLLNEPGTEDVDMELIGEVAKRLGRPVEHIRNQGQESPWFLAVELELLLHHLAETLLRLYFGHLDQPPCPWLAISSLRTPGQFKKLVETVKNQTDEELTPSVERIFFNNWIGLVPEDEGSLGGDIQGQSVRIATAFLREAAKRHLADAGFYNAAKHGFALQPRGMQVGIVLDSDDALAEDEARESARAGRMELQWRGPSVGYLIEKKHGENDERLYVEVTQWMEYADQIATAIILLEMVHNLWAIARGSYTSTTEAIINTWERPTPRELGEMRQNTLSRKEMALGLRKLSSAARTITITIYGGPASESHG